MRSVAVASSPGADNMRRRHTPWPDRQKRSSHSGSKSERRAGRSPPLRLVPAPETAYIGISYAVRPPESDRPRFVTCCSQVFDAEGSGLEFVAYDAHGVEVQRDNPFLSRIEMFRVMTRSLDLYYRRSSLVSKSLTIRG